MSKDQCTRCHRALKDPKSMERGMGPVCWAASNGNVFEKDLEVSEKEWVRRKVLLEKGGEIDLGVNWQYMVPGDMLPAQMRVSVRYKDGAFEAYGKASKPGYEEEIYFARGGDIRSVYARAVSAGPNCTAQAHWAKKQAARQARKMMRKAG